MKNLINLIKKLLKFLLPIFKKKEIIKIKYKFFHNPLRLPLSFLDSFFSKMGDAEIILTN